MKNVAKYARKNNRLIEMGAAVVAVIVLVGGVGYYASQQSRPSSANGPYKPKAEEGQATQPTSPSTNATPTIPVTSEPQTSKNGQVTITSPTQGSTVTSGTKVNGTASGVSKLSYRLKGVKSGQLALGQVSLNSSLNSPSPFSFELAFTNQVFDGSDQGVLEIFTTGSDGSEQSIASVTVNIKG